MRFRTKLILVAAISAVIASSASAQNMGTGQQGGGQGGGQGGSQGGQDSGLQFGAGQGLGVQSQQMQTVSNSVTNASSNVLGGYYANPYFQGRIGTYGAQSPGGFGQALYNAAGGAGGASSPLGNRVGGNAGFGNTANRARTGGVSGNTGFGGQGGATQGFSGGSSSFGGTGSGGGGMSFGGTASGTGGRTGQTGFGGGQVGGGIGGAQSMIGGGLGGRQGQFGNRGMGGTTNPNAVAADRAVNVFFQPAGIGTIGRPQTSTLASRAQSELRTQYDSSSLIAAGKSIDVQVNGDGIARLKGSVASEDEKRMAIGLARLTPGVRMVVSELTVTPAP